MNTLVRTPTMIVALIALFEDKIRVVVKYDLACRWPITKPTPAGRKTAGWKSWFYRESVGVGPTAASPIAKTR